MTLRFPLFQLVDAGSWQIIFSEIRSPPAFNYIICGKWLEMNVHGEEEINYIILQSNLRTHHTTLLNNLWLDGAELC